MLNEPQEPIILLHNPPKRFAVVRAVKTEIQPGSSFFTYHEECWHGQKATLVETALTAYGGLMGSIRKVPLAEVADTAVCLQCGQSIATLIP